jgi:ABC-2 type transport system permease protein
MFAIYKRELKSYFLTAMGYVFLTIFMIILGILFYFNNVTKNSADLQSYYQAVDPLYLIIFTVILTMRLMTDDKRNRTEVLLLTAPVSAGGIVMGKFLAAFSVYGMAVLSTIIYAIYTLVFSQISLSVVVGGMIGLLLYGALFIAIGTFISSLTDSQVVAAIATFCSLFFLYIAESFISFIPNTTVTNVLYWLALDSKYNQISQGLLSIGHLVYFLSLTALFLFLTVRVIEKKRWA